MSDEVAGMVLSWALLVLAGLASWAVMSVVRLVVDRVF